MMRILPYRTSNNVIDGVVVTFVPLDGLNQAEAHVREAREYVERVVSTVREPLLVLEGDLRIASASEAFRRAFQIDTEDLVGRRIYELDKGAWNIPELRRLLEQVLRQNEWRVTLHDVTQRKQAEQALRESEERLRLALQGAKGGVWDWDLTRGTTGEAWWSPEMYDLWGVAPGTTMRLDNSLAIVHEEDRERVRACFEESVARSAHYQCEFRIRHPARGERWMASLGQFIVDASGRPARLLGVTLDIADRKRAEQERLDLEAQLRQAQKMEAVGQLAGGVAHDFANILTAILGIAEISLGEMKRQRSPHSGLIAAMEQIEESAQRASRLTRQLLTFSRRHPAKRETVNLNRVLTNVEKMLRRLIRENIVLESVTAPDLKVIQADTGQLEQVIVNLVVNAADAMPEGGKLTIATGNVHLTESDVRARARTRAGRYAVLTVHDTGCGMDRSTIERVFEPFFTTKGPGKGSGLGLATVYGIVTQSGGHIEVRSEVGQGSTFKVFWPVGKGAFAERVRPRAAEARERRRATILVCEDDDPVRKLLAQMLGAAGYTVLTAARGAEALDLARACQGTIDLLITDAIMPNMNGRELADALHEDWPDLPALFISGYPLNVVTQQGDPVVPVEGAEFLEKPFSQDRLLGRVRDVLDRAMAKKR